MQRSRLVAVVAKQRQNDAIANAKAVVDEHTQWVLSHLSQADRDLIHSVTGEVIEPGAKTASLFALTLAESRVSSAATGCARSQLLLRRPQPMIQHDRVATFTSMRAMLGNGTVGRALDTEA